MKRKRSGLALLLVLCMIISGFAMPQPLNVLAAEPENEQQATEKTETAGEAEELLAEDEEEKLAAEPREVNVAYVAAKGNDATGDGTEANPFKTLNKAYAEVVDKGIICVLGALEIVPSEKSPDRAVFNQNKEVTIVGKEGVIKALNTTEDAKIYPLIEVTAGKVTFQNITVSGSGKDIPGYGRFFSVARGEVVFGTGAVICDYNSQYDSEGGIRIGEGTVTVDGGIIRNITAAAGTFRVWGTGGGKLVIKDGLIENCDSLSNEGSAVYLNGVCDFIMTGGTITKCGQSGDVKGTVYLHPYFRGNFTMTGGAITGNAAKIGGGVYMAQPQLWDGEGTSLTPKAPEMHLGGAPVIAGNYTSDGENSNLFLEKNQNIILDSALTAGANVYVYTAVNPADEDVRIATSDNQSIATASLPYFHSDVEASADVRVGKPELSQSTNDVWLSKDAVKQAKIGNTYYLTVEEAIKAASAGQTVEILEREVTPINEITLPDNVAIKGVNGETYKGVGSSTKIKVDAAGNVTLLAGKLEVSPSTQVTNPAVTVQDGDKNYQVSGQKTYVVEIGSPSTATSTEQGNVIIDGISYKGKDGAAQTFPMENPFVSNTVPNGCTAELAAAKEIEVGTAGNSETIKNTGAKPITVVKGNKDDADAIATITMSEDSVTEVGGTDYRAKAPNTEIVIGKDGKNELTAGAVELNKDEMIDVPSADGKHSVKNTGNTDITVTAGTDGKSGTISVPKGGSVEIDGVIYTNDGEAPLVVPVENPADSFIKTYLSGEEGVYNEVTPDNYEQILAGADAWKKLTDAGKNTEADAKLAADDAESYNSYKEYADAAQKIKEEVEQFVKDNMQDEETGVVYNDVTDDNYQWILDCEEKLNELYPNPEDAGRKDSMRNAIARDWAAKAGKTAEDYQKLLDKAKATAGDYETADKFIKDYLCAEGSSETYNEITADNYEQILSGEGAADAEGTWKNLSAEVQAKIDKKLAGDNAENYNSYANGADSYLAKAKEFADHVNNFVNGTNVKDADGNFYKEITADNYEEILEKFANTGKGDWDGLTPEEKKAVNAVLKENGVNPADYDELVKTAQSMKDAAEKFVNDNLKNQTTVTDANYTDIINAKENWENLSAVEKQIADKMLKEKDENSKGYEALFEEAKAKQDSKVDAFVNNYLSKDAKIFTEVNDDNYQTILAGEFGTDANDGWAHLTEEERALVNAKLKAAGAEPDNYEAMLAGAKKADANKKAAEEFFKKYLCDENGSVFGKVTDENYAQIYDGKDVFEAFDEETKAEVNKLLEAQGKKAAYPTVQEYLAAVETMKSCTDRFVKEYLTGKNGKIYTSVTDENYAQLLSGKEDWAKMSELEKAVVNAALKAAGAEPDNYEAMLKLAVEKEKTTDAANKFIQKYLSDKDGKVYNAVNGDNYAQLLSGKMIFKNLRPEVRAEIDRLLANDNAKKFNSYAEYLKAAEEAEKADKTDDDDKDSSNDKDNNDNEVTDVTKEALSFIEKYLSDKAGKTYNSVGTNNYGQIFAGRDVYEHSSDAVRAEIDRILAGDEAEKYNSYYEYLADAYKIAEIMYKMYANSEIPEKDVQAAQAGVTAPKTDDNMGIGIVAAMLLLLFGSAIIVADNKKKVKVK